MAYMTSNLGVRSTVRRTGSEFLTGISRKNVSESISSTASRPVPNGLLSRIDDDAYSRLSPFIKEVALEKDEYIYQQDGEIDAVYFPVSSVISEFQILEDGRTIEVAITGDEGAVGVEAAFGVSKAANCMQVCVPGSAWKLNVDVLEREVIADAHLRRVFHESVTSNIRQLSQKIICTTFHSLEERFCTWILMMTERSHFGLLHVTQEHVARALGVHRPSVTCIAQALRDKHLIDYRRGRVVVINRGKLEKQACACYVALRGGAGAEIVSTSVSIGSKNVSTERCESLRLL